MTGSGTSHSKSGKSRINGSPIATISAGPSCPLYLPKLLLYSFPLSHWPSSWLYPVPALKPEVSLLTQVGDFLPPLQGPFCPIIRKEYLLLALSPNGLLYCAYTSLREKAGNRVRRESLTLHSNTNPRRELSFIRHILQHRHRKIREKRNPVTRGDSIFMLAKTNY